MASQRSIIPTERIERSILLLRGQKVILDEDWASLYGVETRRLNEQVKRNQDRFPRDFMYRLTTQECSILKSQIETASWGGRRKPPLAFTEHGTIMAATVLNSPRAVQVSIEVVRSFVRLRQMLASHEKLARTLDALEQKYDMQFKAVFDAVRQLMEPPPPKRRKQIGYLTQLDADDS